MEKKNLELRFEPETIKTLAVTTCIVRGTNKEGLTIFKAIVKILSDNLFIDEEVTALLDAGTKSEQAKLQLSINREKD